MAMMKIIKNAYRINIGWKSQSMMSLPAGMNTKAKGGHSETIEKILRGVNN